MLNDLANRLGVKFFDWQDEFFADIQVSQRQRSCLYFKTGAGKTSTALVGMALMGHTEVLVITPPSTYAQWIAAGAKVGVEVECMSHAKFRMKDTKLSRTKPVIADEMHLFGGHGGKGWIKLDRLAGSLKAPMILASATPNYNDADRVYCIEHILDPLNCRGGFLAWISRHCTTEPNHFGMMPIVTGFLQYPDDKMGAAKYLASLPGVFYLEDDLNYEIVDLPVRQWRHAAFEDFGYDPIDHRLMASGIEEKHRVIQRSLIEAGFLRPDIYDELGMLVGNATTPVLVFANHSTVADALGFTLHFHKVKHAVITGSTPAKKKAAYIAAFNAGVFDVLVGTASLATGTDGMDKVCDTLVILDDTEDPSLRRQLIGRIMPRGLGGDASTKQVYRFTLS